MDVYMDDLSLLNNRNKITPANYIEQNGFFVPRRNESLEWALSLKKPFLVRDESIEQYSEISGLGNSPLITEESITYYKKYFIDDKGKLPINEFKKNLVLAIANIHELSQEEFETLLFKSFNRVQQYCNYFDIDIDEYKSRLKFSYWEFVPGLNFSIIADDVIPHKHHLWISKPYCQATNYSIIENGEEQKSVSVNLGVDFKDKLKIIEFYEEIRSLSNFDKNNCAKVEGQLSLDKKLYFLQYMRGRDFQESEFKLDRSLKRGEVSADFVRGQFKGDLNVNIDYFLNSLLSLEEIIARREKLFKQIVSGEVIEESSFDSSRDPFFEELMSRKRKLKIFRSELSNIVQSFNEFNHTTFSGLYNPQLTLIKDLLSELLSPEELESLKQRRFAGELTSIPLHIEADGRKAYVKKA